MSEHTTLYGPKPLREKNKPKKNARTILVAAVDFALFGLRAAGFEHQSTLGRELLKKRIQTLVVMRNMRRPAGENFSILLANTKQKSEKSPDLTYGPIVFTTRFR